MYKYLGSSQNPEQLALRIKSVLLALIPVLIYFSGLFGYNIGSELWQNLIEYIIQGITAAVALYSVVLHVWGWIRALKK